MTPLQGMQIAAAVTMVAMVAVFVMIFQGVACR